MKRITFGLSALAVAAALAGGCGGGDDDGGADADNADKAPTKPEYVRQANAICRRFNAQVERLAEKHFAELQDESELTAAKSRAFMNAALPKYEKQIGDLRAIKPPRDDEDDVKEIYDTGEQEGTKIKTSIADDREVRRLVTTDTVTPRFQKLSKEYGLDTCAQG